MNLIYFIVTFIVFGALNVLFCKLNFRKDNTFTSKVGPFIDFLSF